MVLHNHPHNATRVAAGRLPVNSLWFWGAGIAPDHVTTRAAAVASDEVLLRALGTAAGAATSARPEGFVVPTRDTLFDLRDIRDLARLQAAWLLPAVGAISSGALVHLDMDFEDGSTVMLERGQRWRFWRRPATALAG